MRLLDGISGCVVAASALVVAAQGAAAAIVFDAAMGASAHVGYITGSDPTASGTAYTHPSLPAGHLIDGNLLTRTDTYSGTEVSPGGSDTAPFDFLGVIWGSAVSDIVAIRLHQFVYFDGGWFGTETGDTNATNAPSPPVNTPAADNADAADVAAPTVQVTTDSGLTWTSIMATEDYVSLVQPQVQANFIGLIATPILFEFSAQSGINGIRLVGYGGGRSDVAGGRDEQGWASAAEFEVGRLVSVPEPGMAGVLGIGLAIIALARRQQKPLGMARRVRP